MIIEIKGDRWKMEINIDQYLRYASFSQWKKVIKLCDKYAPENMGEIAQYLIDTQQYAIDYKIPAYTNLIDINQHDLEELENDIVRYRKIRDSQRRGSDAWEKWRNKVKGATQQRILLKAEIQDNKRHLKDYTTRKAKAEKILEYLTDRKG